ncbi:hypothetical protein NQZ68_006140 [Dissostichus eleginoides]|nr:hypothetical protein NQZ68_006140 [Dissostichus eleginoides]
MGDGFTQSPLPGAITSEGNSSQDTSCSPIGSPAAGQSCPSTSLKSEEDSPLATAQQKSRWGGTWKPFQASVRLQSKVGCSLSSEPLKGRLAALTCE